MTASRFAARRLLIVAALPLVASCAKQPPIAATAADSAGFAAMQDRGKAVMGVDQYTSMHVFEDLPTGGRILLERPDSADPGGIATIRQHMRAIASAFAAGDFTLPGQVHARPVPGTPVMTTLRRRIEYRPVDLPRGGSVEIVTHDTAAVTAIHTFLAFQRQEHHAAGHDHTM